MRTIRHSSLLRLLGAKMMLQTAYLDSCNQRYIFSATKSKILIANPNQQAKLQLETFPLSIGDTPIDVSTQETHLGVERTPNDKSIPTLEARFTMARRAMYAMMGAGLHGLNGLNPTHSKKLLDIYIVPRLMHSLEALILTETEVKKLECVYRDKLKQIQHLPKNTATPAIYLLVGAIPAEGLLDMKILSFFNRICQQDKSLEHEIVGRQLAIKDSSSNSWTSVVKRSLQKYDLPDAHSLFRNPMKKNQWKNAVKNAVVKYWDEHLKKQAKTMSTLKYLNTRACSVSKPHPCYLTTPTDPLAVSMTAVKTKLLVQRYPLTASHTSGKLKQSLCPMCRKEPEDTHHFLLRCRSIGSHRQKHINKIQQLLKKKKYKVPPLEARSMDWYTQLILDPSMLTSDDDLILDIEYAARHLTYNLHHLRAIALGGGSKYNKKRYSHSILKIS